MNGLMMALDRRLTLSRMIEKAVAGGRHYCNHDDDDDGD